MGSCAQHLDERTASSERALAFTCLSWTRGVFQTVSQAAMAFCTHFGGGTRTFRLSRFASTMVSESGRAVGCALFCLYGRGSAGLRRLTCVWSVNIGLSSGPCGGRWPRRSTRAASFGCRTNWCAQAGRSCHVPEAAMPPVPLLSRGLTRCTRGLARRPWSGGCGARYPAALFDGNTRLLAPPTLLAVAFPAANDTPTIPSDCWVRNA